MERKLLQILVIAGFLALAASAYAANSITIEHPAAVNGKQLAAGQYDLKISSTGDVSFLRGKTEVATVKARVEDRDKKAPNTIVVTKTNGGNSLPSITEIQFGGKKQVLTFENAAQASNQQ
jgi:biopolymer transport protein ExbD